jgi:YcaO-like protein with predicted kinase domain
VIDQAANGWHGPAPSGIGDVKRHLEGTHRAISPTATVARLKPLQARMGITRIADVTGLDRIGIPVVVVCRPNARSLAVSQGKGVDLAAATASGLMEAVELFHAEHIALPLKLSCRAELAPNHRLIDVERLPRVAGPAFDDYRMMLWVEGSALGSGEMRWLPYECVHANFTVPPPPGSGCFDSSSNGLASGNTASEALCHALAEVIERDATALWNRLDAGRRAACGVDLGTVEDKACQLVLARLADAAFDVAVWDTTTDVGVPSFFCLIVDRLNATDHHGIGAGTHLSPAIALLRALTEAVQVRTTYISGARDDLEPAEYSEENRRHKARVAARLRAEHIPGRDFCAIPDRSAATLVDDLTTVLSLLASAGCPEAVAVDLGKPEFGIPVMRVVVPGLEGPDDHEGYLPGPRARRLLEAAS